MPKWYSPLLDIVVCLLAFGSAVHYAVDHGYYNSAVIYLLLAIFVKLGVIANRET